MNLDKQLFMLAIAAPFIIFPLGYTIGSITDMIAEKKERDRIQRILEGRCAKP